MAKNTSLAGNEPGSMPAEMELPSEARVKQLAKVVLTAMNIAADESAIINEAINAAKDHGIHAQAFRSVIGELKKEAEWLADYLAHQAYYRDILGVTAKAAAVQRLPLEDDNVVPLTAAE